MNIPKKIKKKNRRYKLIKVYENYALYENVEYGFRECFQFFDLGLVRYREKERLALKGGAVKI